MIFRHGLKLINTQEINTEGIDAFFSEYTEENDQLWLELKEIISPFFPEGKGMKYKATRKEIIRIIRTIARDYLVARAAVNRQEKLIAKLKNQMYCSDALFEITDGMRR